MRGNRNTYATANPTWRSIPACAGEPYRPLPARPVSAVYPRVCGGTLTDVDCGSCPKGLSPRVRGNPFGLRHCHAIRRSIPACAGEPDVPRTAPLDSEVYPRVCGGTPDCRLEGGSVDGLSPRVRGNHRRPECNPRRRRSIPACAGEPVEYSSCRLQQAVYPRVCGGTPLDSKPLRILRGLSPRVRGNLFGRR